MLIRPFQAADLQPLIDLTISTFRPFYEVDTLHMMGADLLQHHHGQWEADYRREVPTYHDPSANEHVAVAEIDNQIAGYVAWGPDELVGSGKIRIVAVSTDHRRQNVGRALCLHAMDRMRADGFEYVGLGTGGEDDFHAPARALYSSLGLRRVPVAYFLGRL
jgi:ribosomal protein S18 acetylase RimI-like enzyme